MIPGWEEETEGDYLKLLHEFGQAAPHDFAARMGVSECCVVYWLTELARQGRIRITAVETLQEGEVPCATDSFLKCQRKATCPAGPFPSGGPLA